MGITTIDIEIANPIKPEIREKVTLMVDSGALYSVIPGEVLKRLGLETIDHEAFFLANGDRIERGISSALFFYQGKWGPSKVVVGEPGDSSLLGVLTLESLGFALDPIRRELRPMKMLLV
ncbi:MAG: aspartyl protease [bacterium]|nr:aspartyl protease [bacterium]